MSNSTTVFNHVEMESWLHALEFYKGEINVWRKRLIEVVTRNTSKEILAQSEHFQNQFIIHEEHIDILNHDVKVFQNKVDIEVDKHNKIYDVELLQTETYLRDRMQTFEHIYIDLKHEYFTFLMKYL